MLGFKGPKEQFNDKISDFFDALYQQRHLEVDVVKKSGFSERYPHKERPMHSEADQTEVMFVSEVEHGRQYCAKVLFIQ